MQISHQEAAKALHRAQLRRPAPGSACVRTVEELARKYHVDLAEVQRHTEQALLLEEDPVRVRRVQELAARIEAGQYHVDAEQVIDMAVRRARADRVAEFE